jgi:hypothetical protein
MPILLPFASTCWFASAVPEGRPLGCLSRTNGYCCYCDRAATPTDGCTAAAAVRSHRRAMRLASARSAASCRRGRAAPTSHSPTCTPRPTCAQRGAVRRSAAPARASSAVWSGRAARARRVWCVSCGAMRSESRVRSGCAKCGQERGRSRSGYAWVPPCLYNWVRRLRRFKTGGLSHRPIAALWNSSCPPPHATCSMQLATNHRAMRRKQRTGSMVCIACCIVYVACCIFGLHVASCVRTWTMVSGSVMLVGTRQSRASPTPSWLSRPHLCE